MLTKNIKKVILWELLKLKFCNAINLLNKISYKCRCTWISGLSFFMITDSMTL